MPEYIDQIKFEVEETKAERVDGRDVGVFAGNASVFSTEDRLQDVVEPGAFKRSIEHNGGWFPVAVMHNMAKIVGRAKVEETKTGLKVLRGEIHLGTENGREAYSHVKNRIFDGMSIGFKMIKAKFRREGGKVIRHLKEVKIREITLAPRSFIANPMALITEVKTVTPFVDLAIASPARAWDAAAARSRVRNWATDDGELDFQKFKRAFYWYDPDRSDSVSAYKLPFADVIDGELAAVPRGIFAAAGAVGGARGGTDIPIDDIPGVQTHIGRYYQKMELTPPWETKTEQGDQIVTPDELDSDEIKTGGHSLDDSTAQALTNMLRQNTADVQNMTARMKG